MTWASLTGFLLAVTLGAMVPGPTTALVIRRAALGGARAAFPVVIGMQIGLFAWAIAAAAGVAALVATSEVAYTVLRVAGVLVLVWLGIKAPFLLMRDAEPHLVRTGGAVLNISSVAALLPYPGLTAYGMSKIALERLIVDLAQRWAPRGVSVNALRVDLPVASEGVLANAPGLDAGEWLAPEVAAEGVEWMLSRSPDYTGRRESLWALAHREPVMADARRFAEPPTTELVEGLIDVGPGDFVEPHSG